MAQRRVSTPEQGFLHHLQRPALTKFAIEFLQRDICVLERRFLILHLFLASLQPLDLGIDAFEVLQATTALVAHSLGDQRDQLADVLGEALASCSVHVRAQ